MIAMYVGGVDKGRCPAPLTHTHTHTITTTIIGENSLLKSIHRTGAGGCAFLHPGDDGSKSAVGSTQLHPRRLNLTL